jgi:hypothetical protein
MNETMRSALQSEQKLGAVRQEVESELGVETAVIDEKVSEVAPYRVYLRTASFSKTKQPVIVQWAFEQDGKVAGFFVRPQPTGLAGEASQAVMDRGRALTTQFYAAKTAELWTKMSDAMKSGLGSEQKFAGFRQQVESQLGTETKVIDEKTVESPPYRIYVRTASFSKSAKPVIVQWAIDGDDIIAGFFVRPGI